MKMSRAIFLTMGCSAGLLLISTAWAASPSYSGSGCRQLFTTSSGFADGAIARNQSSSAVTFICGALQLGGAISSWRVSVRDTTMGGQVTCFARASSEFDSGAFVTPSSSSGISFSGSARLGTGVAGTSSYFANGTKYIQCDMPPAFGPDGSAVASYSITEL
jgi:hypothetical protein